MQMCAGDFFGCVLAYYMCTHWRQPASQVGWAVPDSQQHWVKLTATRELTAATSGRAREKNQYDANVRGEIEIVSVSVSVSADTGIIPLPFAQTPRVLRAVTCYTKVGDWIKIIG